MRNTSRFMTMIEFWLFALLVVLLDGASAPFALAQPRAFVTNNVSHNGSVIDTTTSPPGVMATVSAGDFSAQWGGYQSGWKSCLCNECWLQYGCSIRHDDRAPKLRSVSTNGARGRPTWLSPRMETSLYVTNYGSTTVTVRDIPYRVPMSRGHESACG
jgi:hypothetical protein